MAPIEFDSGLLLGGSFDILGKDLDDSVIAIVGSDVKLLHGGDPFVGGC